MKIKKSSIFGVFGALYLCFFLIFTFLAFQPQTVEANTNLILEIPKINLTSPIRSLEISENPAKIRYRHVKTLDQKIHPDYHLDDLPWQKNLWARLYRTSNSYR